MKNTPYMVGFAAFLATIYVPALSFLISGPSAYFKFFAADTFYYLSIASNTSWSTIASFDGAYPTNGFHPIWQFLLKFIFSNDITQHTQIAVVFWLSVVLVGMSASVVAYALKKHLLIESPWLILMTLTPGFLYFIIALPNSNYGHIWSYANGMESALSLFFFSLLFLFVINRDKPLERLNAPNYFVIGLLISLVILTRLDDVFMLAGVMAVLLLSQQKIPEKLRRCIYVSTIPTVLIIFYMYFNYHYAGSPIPLSGQAKNGLSVLGNGSFFVNSLIPVIPVKDGGWLYWNETTWRALHNVVPPIIASMFLIFYFRNFKDPAKNVFEQYDKFLVALALYVIFKGSYNFLFVTIWSQGHWYYPISILIANTLVARSASIFIKANITSVLKFHLSPRYLIYSLLILALIFALISVVTFADFARASEGSFIIAMAATVLCFVSIVGLFAAKKKNIGVRMSYMSLVTVLLIPLVGNSILSAKERSFYNRNYEVFFNNRQNTRYALNNLSSDVKLLSFDDGIVAYSLQIPTMSGLGFALDNEAHAAKERGDLLGLAHSRGYRWLTSLNYMPNFDARIGDDVTSHIEAAFWFDINERNKYQFRLLYADSLTDFKVVSIEPLPYK